MSGYEQSFDDIFMAGGASISGITTRINQSGAMYGAGISATPSAIQRAGGQLDAMIEAFGGSSEVTGGSVGERVHKKSAQALKLAKRAGAIVDAELSKKVDSIHKQVEDLQTLGSLAKSALKECKHDDHSVSAGFKTVIEHIEDGAKNTLSLLEKDLGAPKQSVGNFLTRNNEFRNAVERLGAHINANSVAGAMSLSFSNVNELKEVAKKVKAALDVVHIKQGEFLAHTQSQLQTALASSLKALTKTGTSEQIKKFFLLDTQLSAEDEELTPTMKLKRKRAAEVRAADRGDVPVAHRRERFSQGDKP